MTNLRHHSLSTSEVSHIRLAAAALDGRWSVEAHVDYECHLSAVLIPEPDNPAKPAFIVWGDNVGIAVGMVIDDAFENLGAFPSTDAAMARIQQQLMAPSWTAISAREGVPVRSESS